MREFFKSMMDTVGGVVNFMKNVFNVVTFGIFGKNKDDGTNKEDDSQYDEPPQGKTGLEAIADLPIGEDVKQAFRNLIEAFTEQVIKRGVSPEDFSRTFPNFKRTIDDFCNTIPSDRPNIFSEVFPEPEHERSFKAAVLAVYNVENNPPAAQVPNQQPVMPQQSNPPIADHSTQQEQPTEQQQLEVLQAAQQAVRT
jgi:hypothetical protein